MSITPHLETAEESIRQALINALSENDDHWLTELFNLLNQTQSLKKKISKIIRTTNNTDQWAKDWSNYNFNLTSDYLSSPDTITFNTEAGGGDTVIKFPIPGME